MSFSFIGENGSPNILLIVAVLGVVGLIAYFAWKFFAGSSNSTGTGTGGGTGGGSTDPVDTAFAIKASNLSTDFQTVIGLFFAFFGGTTPMPMSYNGTNKTFTISQIPSGSDFQGVVLTSSDNSVKIYLSYYEYLVWSYSMPDAAHPSTLYVPARTLTNGVITTNPTGGYSISGTLPQSTITSLTGTTAPRVVDFSGTLLPTTTAPVMPGSNPGGGSNPAPNPNAPTFATKLSDLPSYYQQDISSSIPQPDGILTPITYNSALTSFRISQIPSDTGFQGILFSPPSNTSVKIYLTYYEYIIWAYGDSQPGHPSSLTVPARTLSNGVITDNATGGYSLNAFPTSISINSLTGTVTPGVVSPSGATVPLTTLPTPPA